MWKWQTRSKIHICQRNTEIYDKTRSQKNIGLKYKKKKHTHTQTPNSTQRVGPDLPDWLLSSNSSIFVRCEHELISTAEREHRWITLDSNKQNRVKKENKPNFELSAHLFRIIRVRIYRDPPAEVTSCIKLVNFVYSRINLLLFWDACFFSLGIMFLAGLSDSHEFMFLRNWMNITDILKEKSITVFMRIVLKHFWCQINRDEPEKLMWKGQVVCAMQQRRLWHNWRNWTLPGQPGHLWSCGH